MIEPFPVDALWFRFVAGILIGLVLGSFTTMLSYRVPRRISIVHPPSQCPHCHTPLKPRDLVPILSWFLERGHCRHCRKPISLRYLVIELITATAATVAFLWLGFTPPLIAALLGIVALVTLATINIERHGDG
ncbi:MAG: prepilin peptidase [Alphaproteobacteria bacterium]|nr:prepilin peptidase [Alphaproteobacteria bacterium]